MRICCNISVDKFRDDFGLWHYLRLDNILHMLKMLFNILFIAQFFFGLVSLHWCYHNSFVNITKNKATLNSNNVMHRKSRNVCVQFYFHSIMFRFVCHDSIRLICLTLSSVPPRLFARASSFDLRRKASL